MLQLYPNNGTTSQMWKKSSHFYQLQNLTMKITSPKDNMSLVKKYKSLFSRVVFPKFVKQVVLQDHSFFWMTYSLCKKCPYLGFFLSVFSPNAGKHAPEKLWIPTFFTQWIDTTNVAWFPVILGLGCKVPASPPPLEIDPPTTTPEKENSAQATFLISAPPENQGGCIPCLG